MKLLTRNTVVIKKARNEVYEFATNMENFKSWFPEVITIESVNSLDHGVVGKKYLEIVSVPLVGKRAVSLSVVEADSEEIFITEGDFYPLMPRMTITLAEESSKRTKLTWSMHSRNDHLMFRTLLFPVFRKIMKKRAELGILNLKRILEQER